MYFCMLNENYQSINALGTLKICNEILSIILEMKLPMQTYTTRFSPYANPNKNYEHSAELHFSKSTNYAQD